jgi:5'-deoxynucleotidase YfbR-like HD superfamily hydrolase
MYFLFTSMIARYSHRCPRKLERKATTVTLQEFNPTMKFERYETTETSERKTERMGAVCLSLANFCMRYAGVERVPRYNETHRENDAEHSLMVAVLSVELANELRPELDKGLLAQFSNVHDFVEIAVGDTPTYHLSEQELLDKHALEQAALESLLDTLPPYTAQLLLQYEQQSSPEARFVRAVDKLAPLLVDILGPGKMVMREDYGITSIAQLLENKHRLDDSMIRRFGEDASEIVDLYQHLGDVFSAEYQASES